MSQGLREVAAGDDEGIPLKALAGKYVDTLHGSFALCLDPKNNFAEVSCASVKAVVFPQTTIDVGNETDDKKGNSCENTPRPTPTQARRINGRIQARLQTNRDVVMRKGIHALVAALMVALCVACKPDAALAGPQPVHGYVYAIIDSDLPFVNKGVAVPDIAVAAKNATTGALSGLTVTDPYGYFRTPALAPGSYNICVSGTGFVGGCDPQVFTITDYAHVMDHIVIIHAKQNAVVGTVLLADKKTPCFWYTPIFDANFVMTAKITLEDGSGNVLAGPIGGNNLGEYVIPPGASPGTYKVTVACEAAQGAKTVVLTTATSVQNFVLNNNAPTVNLLEAAKAGVGVRRASPNDALTIKVPAADLDHDPLHYKWVDESGSTASFPDAATVNWSAPTTTGTHVLRVQVSDGRGGYAVGHTIINVGADEMLFTGAAFNRATHAPVAGASVNLNGVTTSTDAGGRFQVKVPETTRFVLNVIKPGFALTSRIFYARATGIQVPLDPVQLSTLDGTQGGKVTVNVTGCKGGSVAESHAADCPREKIGVLSFGFEPGSLVSGATAFTGTATVESFQFDLTLPNAIPGDLSAKYRGADARLQTFGAFHIQARDASGNPLQLAAGKSVQVSMPIHPLALATAPGKIPFFSYEESTGFWVEHGELTRVGNQYVGKITHFSEFNADSTGGSSCMQIQLDQGPQGFPSSVILNASYVNPSVGNFNHPNTGVNDTVHPIVIERLMPSQDFHLQISDGTTHAVLQMVLLNSGPPVTVPFPVPYPYDGCKPAVIFNNNSIPPTSDHFLISGTIADNSVDYQTQTTTGNYAGRGTFSTWLSTNHFGGGAAETKAVYLNNGDLKFGRSMHCRSVSHAGTPFSQDYIACYVSNFGSVGLDFGDQPHQTGTSVLSDAYSDTNDVIATVAMEYHPDQTDRVQFWAYKGDGSYLPKPALDVEGAKPMPDMCIGCHQGTYGGAGTLVNGARFLPFDIDSFLGDDGNALQGTLGSGAPRPAQADFRQLNQFVLQASDNGSGVSPAFQRLMDIWYKDGGHPTGVNDPAATYHFGQGAAALNTFPGHPALYDDVVRPVCRTCHVARDPTSNTGDTWDDFVQLSSKASFIGWLACGPGNDAGHNTMPHAQVPYKRFWETSLESTLASELTIPCLP
jgi:hypothetical protein